jgi:ABC-type glycerol-3-phosphate transport system permease component
VTGDVTGRKAHQESKRVRLDSVTKKLSIATAADSPLPTGAAAKRRTQVKVGLRLLEGLAIIMALLIGFPFFYMVTTSLKSLDEVYRIPLVILPAEPQWGNYLRVWNLLPFARFTINSVIYTVSITVGEFLMGLAAGYAFARVRFPHKDWIFLLILFTFAIPGEITLIPRFMLLNQLQWINTYAGLIVPELSSAFNVFLLREYIRTLPDEIFDAAKMDGAGHFRQLFQLVLPMSRPIVATLLLLSFVSHWNAYLWPLIVTNSEAMRTLPIGVQYIKAALELPEWQLVMAGSTIVILPLVVLFIVAQKQFVEGTIQGALKG